MRYSIKGKSNWMMSWDLRVSLPRMIGSRMDYMDYIVRLIMFNLYFSGFYFKLHLDVQFKKAEFMYVFLGSEVSKYVIALPVMPLRVNDWHNGPLFTPLVWAWPSSPVSPSASTLLHAPNAVGNGWKRIEGLKRRWDRLVQKAISFNKNSGLSSPTLLHGLHLTCLLADRALPGHSPCGRPLFWHLKSQVCSMWVMMPRKIPNVTNKIQQIIKPIKKNLFVIVEYKLQI